MDTNEVTTILRAIYAGNTKKVIALVQKIDDVNAVGDDEMSLLMTAAFHGKADIARWLLKKGARVDQKDAFDKTALIYGADQGYPEVVKVLLEHGADINTIDEQAEWKPLDYAAARDHEDVVKIMLDLRDSELSKEDRHTASLKTKNNKIKELLLHPRKE